VGVNVPTNRDAHLHIAVMSWEHSRSEWISIRWEVTSNIKGKPEDSKLDLANILEGTCLLARYQTPFTQMVECFNMMACSSHRMVKVNSTKAKHLNTCRCYQVLTWKISSFTCNQWLITNTWVSTLQASSSKWWLLKAFKWTQLIFNNSFSNNKCPASLISTPSQLKGS
jgi:hypothetical protein